MVPDDPPPVSPRLALAVAAACLAIADLLLALRHFGLADLLLRAPGPR